MIARLRRLMQRPPYRALTIDSRNVDTRYIPLDRASGMLDMASEASSGD